MSEGLDGGGYMIGVYASWFYILHGRLGWIG